MFFSGGIKNKRVKELRKNRGLTARELAQQLKVDTIEILKIEDKKLKEVDEPLKSRLTPVLRGDDLDKIPW
ncbi:MAG: transcriptional regulator [Syntrophomonadaceae bacterium]|nr:transcriptional regulator [Syntrophomonadaceae bacterium]MDD3890168.1 transcriptional regulator [Syntrophomonadaceae bacterium]MDD4550544.1 transcriptional regulator [Syntrophomonadaceae bacterium]